MSGYLVHQKVGFVAGIASIVIVYFLKYVQVFKPLVELQWFIYPLAIPIAVLYSLLPDIDIKSKGSQIFYSIILITLIILCYYNLSFIASIIAIISIIPQLFSHRNFTHSLWFALIFPVPFYFLFVHFNLSVGYFILFYISALSGYLSHLILDKF
jgi:membrane-bound metal-dependent hydrolase YbcI (DUF457 family)